MQSSGPGGASVLRSLPSLSLYIHLPWCIRKCPYCDFNSHEIKDDPPQEAYLNALVLDLQASLPQIWGRPVQSVFIGGGTPNVFGPERIHALLNSVRSLVPLAADCEITMEANPGAGRYAQEATDWRAYRQAGVTRLSLGIQSFNAESLQAIGRVHTADDSHEAAQAASKAFDRLNIDLMYGLPGQTLAMAVQDVESALASGSGHLSLYQLTLEPNTLFAARPPVLPVEEVLEAMHEQLLARLADSDLHRYEVSAFARPDQVCRHNLNYWRFGDYLGIGAGAHSKLSLPDLGIVRQTCLRHPAEYLQGLNRGDGSHRKTEPVPLERLGFEFMLNALRLVEGVESDLFEALTGQSAQSLESSLGKARARGLLRLDRDRWAASERGFDFLNELQILFLP